jgi:hypoxanthine phosphoribosyltransferase|tara:strand:+ start:764 stop:1231 length:468 start_codon:yes stop_codon:yes gene_type:complete
MKKKFYTHKQIDKLTEKIVYQLAREQWKPDYVIGLTRGGLIPAVYISHILDVPMLTLKINLRDHVEQDNLYEAHHGIYDLIGHKKILIVDDINDTGATLNYILDQVNVDQQSADLKFAVLIDNLSSDFKGTINYAGTEINKAEEPVWIVYPWEVD